MRQWVVVTLVVGLGALPLRAQSTQSTQINEQTLANGLHVIYAPLHQAPLVHVRMVYHVGSRDDPPQAETVGGLANREDGLVNKIFEDVGVKPYEGSVKFLHQIRHQGFKIAVVTSSEHCDTALRVAKLDAFFDVRVDGNMVYAQHLAGKPAPDTFLMGAKLLGVDPIRAIVIEDAISGVEAGCAGNFGLVIGVARKGNAEELRHHGAHLVVNDLGELVS